VAEAASPEVVAAFISRTAAAASAPEPEVDSTVDSITRDNPERGKHPITTRKAAMLRAPTPLGIVAILNRMAATSKQLGGPRPRRKETNGWISCVVWDCYLPPQWSFSLPVSGRHLSQELLRCTFA